MANSSELRGYPSTFVSSEEKSSKSWGLQYLKTMWEDARNRGSSYSFEDRASEFIENRKYSEGKQSVSKYYQKLGVDEGDVTFQNFNFETSNPLPEIAEYIVGTMINHPYKPTAKAIDSQSKTEVDKKRRELEFNMMIKDVAPEIEQATGNNPLSGAKVIPEDEEDIELYMNVTYKQARCIATEELVKHFKLKNDFRHIERKTAKDLVDNKICGVRVYVDEGGNVRARNIDPVHLISDFVIKDNFTDAKHIGEVIEMTIEELRVEAQGQFTEEELQKIAEQVQGKNGNGSWDFNDRKYYRNGQLDESYYNHFKIKVLDAEVKTTNKLKFQKQQSKNGGYFFQEKPHDFKPPKNPKRKRDIIEKHVEVSYTGKYIVDTNYIYDWGLKKNMIRRRMNSALSSKVELGFIINAPNIYEMENQSIVRRMIPYADELVLTRLKIQQLIMEAAPSGYAINQDAASAALDGMGVGGMTPIEARKLRNAIGDIYFRSIDQNGNDLLRGGQPVYDLPNGLDASLERLVGFYNATVSNMREVAGIPRGVDGSKPDEKALIGTQKLAMEGANNALRVLREAFFDVQRRTFNQAVLLYQRLIENDVNVSEIENALGADVINEMELTELTNADFDIDIKMLPVEEEKAVIRSYLNLSIQNQQISIEDAIVVEGLMEEDVEKAASYLITARKRFDKKKQQMAAQNAQMNAEQQKQSALAAAEAKKIEELAKAESKIAVDNNKIQRELEKELEIAEAERKTKALEFEYKIKLLQENARLKNSASAIESGDEEDGVMAPKIVGEVEPDMLVSSPTANINE